MILLIALTRFHRHIDREPFSCSPSSFRSLGPFPDSAGYWCVLKKSTEGSSSKLCCVPFP